MGFDIVCRSEEHCSCRPLAFYMGKQSIDGNAYVADIDTGGRGEHPVPAHENGWKATPNHVVQKLSCT